MNDEGKRCQRIHRVVHFFESYPLLQLDPGDFSEESDVMTRFDALIYFRRSQTAE